MTISRSRGDNPDKNNRRAGLFSLARFVFPCRFSCLRRPTVSDNFGAVDLPWRGIL
jgi:hypothetical protein